MSSTYQKNIHISRCPETINLRVIAERILCRHQQRFNINVWAKIVGDCLVAPHVLPYRLTGNHLHDLPKLLEAVPLAVRARVWYMHDGALCCARCSHYHEGWIGRGGHFMASTLTWLQSSGFLPMGTPKCSSCWQGRGTSPSHCGCLSDYPQLPRHLWTDAAVHDGTCRGVEDIVSTHY
jgi:hypothetical protein